MQFNSLTFLVFLPIVFLLYWKGVRGLRWQNLLIVTASYVFYGWWDARFLLLIVLTSMLSFAGGLLTERYEGRRNRQKMVCTTVIVSNLLILAVFKYFNFFVTSLVALVRPLGIEPDWVTLHVVLPVGISFYTFQALSYTIDVYRKELPATHDVVEFLAYISFFPQLVAGPIERASRLLPQFQRHRRFDYGQAVDGCRQMLWGFFKKMVIADNCALAVNQIWAGYQDQTGLVLMVGGVLFAFQIYCDFSGYSDIAIGCARLFGFSLVQNFDYPYFSRSIPEFWHRWHISLTTWFRDYVYIPLGGSREGRWKTVRNIYVVWAVSGLWHGANWTFVWWGLYHGTLLTASRLPAVRKENRRTVACGHWLSAVREGVQMSFTFFLVVTGWVVFRAGTMGDAVAYLDRMYSTSLLDVGGSADMLQDLRLGTVVPAIVFMLLCEWVQRSRCHALQLSSNSRFLRYTTFRYAFYIVLAMMTLALAGSSSEFIYFQF